MPHRWCRACLAVATKSLPFRCMRMKQKGGTRPWKKLAVWHATFKVPTKAFSPSQILSPKILLPWKIVMLCFWPSHLHSMSRSAAETSKTSQSSKQKMADLFSLLFILSCSKCLVYSPDQPVQWKNVLHRFCVICSCIVSDFEVSHCQVLHGKM